MVVRIILIFLLIAPFAHAEVKNPAMVVHLLDYLAKDYGGAVQNGKVISQSEYSEQMEFAETVASSAKTISDYNQDQNFVESIEMLTAKIKNKEDAKIVSELARQLQAEAIKLAKIEISPSDFPKLSEGKTLFARNCVMCHGESGAGDGLAGKQLNPKPANFHLAEKKMESSPFQYFNTIRLGVPGTGMPAFIQFSDKETWALAFYVKSLGYKVSTTAEEPALELKEIASLKDGEIFSKLTGTEVEKTQTIVKIRTYESVTGDNHLIGIARTHLDNSFRHFNEKDYPQANAEALKSYLEGIELLEPKIKANKEGLVEKIEAKMSSYRAVLNQQSALELVRERYKAALATIDEVEEVTQKKEMSSQVAFSAAFAIFLREGFEAVLIIITLLGVIKAFNAKSASRWVHLGWISALALGGLIWIGSGLLVSLSGASREVLEGSISLFAVGVLIYVGFWMHRQTEVGRWTKFIKETVKNAVEQKSLFVLFGISFISVFREAIEVVLFLRAVWDDVGVKGHSSVGLGVLSAFVLIFAFSYAAVRFSQRIPVRQLFTVSSVIMVVLSVILTGKGVHSLQEAGIIGVNSLFTFRLDLLGVYPSVQSTAAQIFIATLLLILWTWDKLFKAETK